MTQFNIGPADGVKPVAWIRAHPDGTLSYDLLRDDQIEQVRKDSGAWRALFTADQLAAAVLRAKEVK